MSGGSNPWPRDSVPANAGLCKMSAYGSWARVKAVQLAKRGFRFSKPGQGLVGGAVLGESSVCDRPSSTTIPHDIV